MCGLENPYSPKYLLSEDVHVFDNAIYILQMQQKEGKREATVKATLFGVGVKVLEVGGFGGSLGEETTKAASCWTLMVLAGSSRPTTGHS